jgi:5'-nucleotidase
MKRRDFINRIGAGTLLLSTGQFPLHAIDDMDFIRMTILHTNDVHSRVDPFPMDGSRNQGLGGAARRAAWIEKVRGQEEHVLLFDSGDIFQGTPYFNFFTGEIEIRLMNEMGYDAATIGNHDYDAGIDRLAEMVDASDFPFLNVNYDLGDTVLGKRVLPYKIFEKGPVKIGVFGVGIELEGLVPKSLYKGSRYLDPIQPANETAALLKNELGCDYVVVLSHLGYRYRDEKVSDVVLAENTDHIDLILGGHTHTFMDEPHLAKNRKGEAVMIHQCGWAGILLGRVDLVFERNKRGRCVSCSSINLR